MERMTAACRSRMAITQRIAPASAWVAVYKCGLRNVPRSRAHSEFRFPPARKRWELLSLPARKPDRVFLGCHHHFQVTADTSIDEASQFRVSVTVMINVTLGDFDFGAELAQAVFEAVGRGDRANGTDVRRRVISPAAQSRRSRHFADATACARTR